jgi:hypothetical protein
VSGVRGERGDGRGGSDDDGRRRDDGGVEDFEVEENCEAIRQAGAAPGNYAEERFVGCLTGRTAKALRDIQHRREEEENVWPLRSECVGTYWEEEKSRWQRRSSR